MLEEVDMYIKVNGKEMNTKSIHLIQLEKELFCGKTHNTIIRIVNGFQMEEDILLNEGDEITFIEKGVMPSQELLESMMCARHTPKVHEKVKKAHVAIAGLGGLGSHIAIALARTGIGYFHLIDFDEVEPSNLNRQHYKIKHLGMSKTEALRQEIEEINPFIHVQMDTVRVTEENLRELFLTDQYICEAFDKPEAKALLVNGILEQFPEKYIVAASGMAGYSESNTIQTKKITDHFYLCGDQVSEAAQGNGLMAPRVSICAGHQANAILRLILGEE